MEYRSLGAHVSKVLSLTLDRWTQEDYAAMLARGNDTLNAELECHPAAQLVKPDMLAKPDALRLEDYFVKSLCRGAFYRRSAWALTL